MEISLERLLQTKRAGGQRPEEVFKDWRKSGLEKMGRDSSVWCATLFFVPRRIMGLCRGAVPPLTVCLPVRMGTVSACDWMPVLALWSGWSLRCRAEWRGRGGVAREACRGMFAG